MSQAASFLTSKIDGSTSEVERQLWQKAEQYYNKRLWHQLTTLLLSYVKGPQFKPDASLYEQFVSDFESKMNPLSLVYLCIPLWDGMESKEAVLEWIERIGNKVKTRNEEAFVLTRVVAGNLYLSHFKQLQETKKVIEEVDELLDGIHGVGKVHARYYYLSSDYYKQQGDHQKYYRACLHYLGCTDLSELSKSSQESLAYHLSLAAILGSGIYNFGELLAHPVLKALNGTEHEWLVQLLHAFNSGNVRRYEELRVKWSKQADLASNTNIMFEKLCLLALMEVAFKRVGHDRLISFDEIASNTGLPVNEVELLVMKSLSQGLVKGHIDQVEAMVCITWVQPRVLDVSQINTICDKIGVWTESIASLENVIENNAAEILTV